MLEALSMDEQHGLASWKSKDVYFRLCMAEKEREAP